MSANSSPKLVELRRMAGRALFIGADGAWLIGRRYSIYRSTNEGQTWEFVARMPCSLHRRVAQISRLACRLLRQEVRAVNCLSDGALVAANREWVYYTAPGELIMRASRVDTSAKFLAPPMSLTVGPGDRIVFGEYDSSNNRKLVRLYVSDDRGRSFSVARTFPAGEILHVHTLVFDARIRKYWLLSGDHGQEPGIGLLSEDLKDFDWLVKGAQAYRAVEVFDFGDRLVYGMDSEREPNWIVSLEKESGRLRRIIAIEGSCIYACRFGRWCVLSTTVEPSKVNSATSAGLWASSDGENWRRVFEARKDLWAPRLFQYGTLVLPRGGGGGESLFFSGQAVQHLDGQALAARLSENDQRK